MLLICSAWQEEVKTLKDQTSIKTLGIGYLEAALNLNNILRDINYSRIIFLGTAGAYSDALSVGDIVSVSSVGLLNCLTIQGQGYLPKEYNSYTSSPTIRHSTTVNCLSSLEITTSETISKTIIKKSPFTIQVPLVENMELYGIAKVAHEHKLPWSALLGITNHTNGNAHLDWKANHEKVSEKLCEAFLSISTNL